MKYTGKQIRIHFLDGDMQIYRGSCYTLCINTYSDYSWIQVYLNGKDYANFPSSSIESVVEDNFGMEELK